MDLMQNSKPYLLQKNEGQPSYMSKQRLTGTVLQLSASMHACSNTRPNTSTYTHTHTHKPTRCTHRNGIERSMPTTSRMDLSQQGIILLLRIYSENSEILSFTLKMVKEVDFAENWWAHFFCQNQFFWAQPFVCTAFCGHNRHTYERMLSPHCIIGSHRSTPLDWSDKIINLK